METIYLKTLLPFSGKIRTAVAISNNGTVIAREGEIGFDHPDDCLGSDFYVKEWKAVESTKAEFDAFYIKTVNELNQIIKEL
jgi:hypothetical protein